MAKYTGETFTGSQNIDGNSYEKCTFNNTTLVYSGGNVPSFNGCTFNDATFQFDGPASNTVTFMKVMAHPSSGLQQIIRGTFAEIFEQAKTN